MCQLKMKTLQLDLRLVSAFKSYKVPLASSKLTLNFLCLPASDMTLVPLLEHNTNTNTHTRHSFMTAEVSCSWRISNNFKISSTQEGKKWGKLNSEERPNFQYSIGDLMG